MSGVGEGRHNPSHAAIARENPRQFSCDCISSVMLQLSGMCPKADDPVSVNQDDRAISVSISTATGTTIEGYVTLTFNG